MSPLGAQRTRDGRTASERSIPRRLRGRVKPGGFDRQRGFCFVRSEAGDYFCHAREFIDPANGINAVQPGSLVEFSPGADDGRGRWPPAYAIEAVE